jgi:hypothetical protein
MIFSAARPIVLNSIVDIAHKTDFVDRSMMVTLYPISDDERRTEVDMEARFADVQPEILAALADAVSCALRNPVTLRQLPRMADFATTIESAAPALGWKSEAFLNVYSTNREEAVDTVVQGDLVYTFLEAKRNLALSRPAHAGGLEPWVGKSQALLQELFDMTEPACHKQLPKRPQDLVGELRRLAPALRKAGIEVIEPKPVRHRGEKTKREMEIRYHDVKERLEL